MRRERCVFASIDDRRFFDHDVHVTLVHAGWQGFTEGSRVTRHHLIQPARRTPTTSSTHPPRSSSSVDIVISLQAENGIRSGTIQEATRPFLFVETRE